MMHRTALLGLTAALAWAQIELRLRYGGPESVYHVRNVSGGTPAIVTVWRHTTGQQQHDLANDEVVYLQFVPGCKEANGYRRVSQANPSVGTFAITDLGGNPITCSAPFDRAFESGLVGRVGTFTLRASRPRILLPGGGPLLERSKDPDGDGPEVAPVVTENDVPWQRAVSGYAHYITPGCDGITPAMCPNEDAGLVSGDGYQGWIAVTAGYVWFADNSKTGHLNLARYHINHAHRAMLTNTSGLLSQLGFPCDNTARHCSWGSGADWISISMFQFAMAYDLIRDQLTPAERTAFARKMLNGWGGEHDCQNQLQKQPGFANLTQGSKTVIGSGFSQYSPGDGVYFKRSMTWGGTGTWGYVVSVAGDSEMTVNFISGASKTASAPATVEGVDHFRVLPWDENKCGAAFVAGGHELNPGAVVRRAATHLAAGIGAEDTTITVQNAGSFPEITPFYVVCEQEVMRVTARSGNRFTVERGQLYSQARSHSSGKPVIWTSEMQGNALGTTGPRAYWGETWEGNLVGQKNVGYLLAAFALAGDDPRAAFYAETMWNYYYDVMYASYLKQYWSGPTQGGLQNQGYQWGRWHGTHWRVGLLSRNALEEGPIEMMDEYFWRGLRTVYLWTPPGTWNRLPHDVGTGDGYSNTSVSWPAMAATLWPGTEAAYATFWYRNLSGLLSSLTGKNAPQLAAYAPPDAQQLDPRQHVQPWSFHSESDYDAGSYYGLVVSKRDWTSTAGMLIAGAGWSWPNDHAVDQGIYHPGGYSLFKGTKLLFGWDNSYGTGGSGSNWMSLANGSGDLRSAIHPPWYSASESGQRNRIDRRHGDQNYVYARGNFTQSWKTAASVARHHRHYLHIKTDPEYVVVFDDAAFQPDVSRAIRTNLQYFLRYDAGQTFSASGDYRNIVFRKPSGNGAMISTRVIFPAGDSPSVSYTQTSNVHRVTFDWGNAPSAQMITVHRLATGTSDVMPTVQILEGLDSDSVGVEVLDPNDPVAVVFAARGTDRTQCSFRTNFARPGRIIISGLAPGSYRVYRDGQELGGSPYGAGVDDGTLYLEGPAGAYLVSAVPPASLSVDPLELSFEYRIGEEAPRPQSLRATCAGGTCLAMTEENCSWLTVRPLSGNTPVEFTVNVDPQGLPAGVHNCVIQVSAAALNSPQQVRVTLAVAEQEEPEPPGGGLSVEVMGATTRRLLVRYGGLGLKRNDTCTVSLSESPGGQPILETVHDAGGPARRIAVLGAGTTLEPGTNYHVRAACGPQSGTVRATTRSSGAPDERRLRFQLRPPANMTAEQVRLEYGPTPALGQSITAGCTAGACELQLQVQGDQILYFKYTYLGTLGAELARSGLQVIAVP